MHGLEAGNNIAMKVPARQLEETVRFYSEVIGLPRVEEERPSAVFEFGWQRLWIDSREDLECTEVWLELVAADVEEAARYLAAQRVMRRDEVEVLPTGFTGFWISNPAGVIHLVSGK